MTPAGIPVCKVERTDFLAAFGLPPPASLKDVQQVAAAIWPVLDSDYISPGKLHAAALGLYLQTERLFH